MKYKGYHFTINPLEPAREILLAELDQLGFESFEDIDKGLSAYIQAEHVQADMLADIYILKQDEFDISYTTEDVEEQNWNAVWESSFEPIRVGNQCLVRAEFHTAEKVDYDIVITPKMAFGTGHHATTYMILKLILEDDFQDLNCLDMGCGTGILGILALMKKAKKSILLILTIGVSIILKKILKRTIYKVNAFWEVPSRLKTLMILFLPILIEIYC